MTVYQGILVAVDGSPASLHALGEALRLADGQVVVVAAAPAATLGIAAASQDLDAYWRETQEKALAAASEVGKQAGVAVKTLAVRGEPHEAILAAAQAQASDLIVMGLKGAQQSPAALMGSTTARLIGFSPMAVLVVPEHAALGFAKILTPVDGSRYSRRAAAEAVRLCVSLGGELLALAVLDAPPGFAQDMPDVAADLTAKLREVTGAVQHQAQTQGVRCQTVVLPGPAYRVITEEARRTGAGLVVMGSHGRTGLKRLLMGSVTERVLGHAPCPVLVVKGKE